ncbi:MAG: lamin tail domain-containing protein, partial [Bacteroidota bacterium]|nr:lamin tail domain-containing protein [Bacteroidota bacterium]
MFFNLSSLRKLLLSTAMCLGIFSNAQLIDNFSDGDFTNTPTWSGDNSQYLVNAGFQLQLNGTAPDTSYLSMLSSSVANTEWNFWVRENFAPSDNNNMRIYLMSDIAALTGLVNGYYVRLGENGSFDSVDLWEQSGTTHTKIIDGINGHCAATNNVLRIRITRDAAGNWNLYSDITGGYNYLPEGNVFDNTHTTSNYFGVFSKYTVSNITNFYYDDFYVGPIIVDVTAPSIVSATPTSATTLDVTFNENVDLTTSQVAANYSVNNGIGVPVSAVRDGADFSIVHLTFTNSFVSAANYVLTVTNVQDLNTNAITSETANFLYFPLSIPVYHDVLINEIFADPSPVVGLPNAEFVELYNRSSNNFDLSGWEFTDGSSTGTLGSHILAAGSYLILCANADTAAFSPFGPTMGLSSWPSLNNAGDNLKIFDAASTPVDSVNFDLSWYRDAVKEDGGWTLELINPNTGNGCAPAGNWIASTFATGGTPGIQNAVFNNSPDVTGPAVQSIIAIDSLHVMICFNEGIDPAQLTNVFNYDIQPFFGNPVSLVYDTATLQCATLTLGTALANNNTYTLVFTGLTDCAGNAAIPNFGSFSYHVLREFDVVINEIMPDPNPPVLLPDEEYLELHNTTSYAISTNGWTLAVGTTVRALPSIVISADSFIVFTSTTAAAFFPGINVVGVTSFPSLTNTGGTITIRDGSGMVIHSLTYSDSWYQDAAKADGGWSLEQIDPLNPCAGASNWKASNANAG